MDWLVVSGAVLLFFKKLNHARRAEFTIEIRILTLQAGIAHLDLMLFTFVAGFSHALIRATCHLFQIQHEYSRLDWHMFFLMIN